MREGSTVRWLVVVALVVVVLVNVLANALPINNIPTGEVADNSGTLYLPEGYVFSIWGIIYLGLIAYAAYQVRPATYGDVRLSRVGWAFIANAVMNSVWLVTWHYESFGLSMLFMLGILGTLIAIYTTLGIGVTDAPAGERWLVRVPFSIYLAWIVVATVANVSIWLIDLGWGGFGLSDVTWTVIMVVVTGLLAGALTWLRRDLAFSLVGAWALVGLALRWPQIASINVASWIVAVALLAVAVLVGYRRFTPPPALPS